MKCIIFDFAFTLCSDHYFKICPNNYPEWYNYFQEKIFSNSDIIRNWLINKITSTDIARKISNDIKLEEKYILKYMRLGCENLKFNHNIYEFAKSLKNKNIYSVLVTNNFDIFTEVVVPKHDLKNIFDVIVNSANYGTDDKNILWNIAFKNIENNISYGNSLLIEDSEANIIKFQKNGGSVYKYINDDKFMEWRNKVNI